MEDVDNDGDMDMVLQFKTQQLDFSQVVDEGGEYPYAYLYGETVDGELFSGKDTVNLIGDESNIILNWIIEHFPIIGQLLHRFLKL